MRGNYLFFFRELFLFPFCFVFARNFANLINFRTLESLPLPLGPRGFFPVFRELDLLFLFTTLLFFLTIFQSGLGEEVA